MITTEFITKNLIKHYSFGSEHHSSDLKVKIPRPPEHRKTSAFIDEMFKWMEDELSGNVWWNWYCTTEVAAYRPSDYFSFENINDAILFKMRWF